MPDTPISRKTDPRGTDYVLTIGLVLAEVVALLILVASVFVTSDQKSLDVTTNQTATGDTKTP
jgi:hypothetical protein